MANPLRALAARFGARTPLLTFGFATGGLANTSFAVTVCSPPGETRHLNPGDVLVAVLELQPPAAASGMPILANRSAGATIPSQDHIQITAASSSDQLLVIWYQLA